MIVAEVVRRSKHGGPQLRLFEAVGALFLAAISPSIAESASICDADLAAVEANFNETIARLEAAGTADHTEEI